MCFKNFHQYQYVVSFFQISEILAYEFWWSFGLALKLEKAGFKTSIIILMLVDCNANMDNENSFNLNSLSWKTQIKISNSLCWVRGWDSGSEWDIRNMEIIWNSFKLDFRNRPTTLV